MGDHPSAGAGLHDKSLPGSAKPHGHLLLQRGRGTSPFADRRPPRAPRAPAEHSWRQKMADDLPPPGRPAPATRCGPLTAQSASQRQQWASRRAPAQVAAWSPSHQQRASERAGSDGRKSPQENNCLSGLRYVLPRVPAWPTRAACRIFSLCGQKAIEVPICVGAPDHVNRLMKSLKNRDCVLPSSALTSARAVGLRQNGLTFWSRPHRKCGRQGSGQGVTGS